MIRLYLHKDFTLPMLGRDAFARLMRAGVEYDRGSRRFRIKHGADLASILAILGEVSKEEVSIELQCVLCGGDAGCSECEFSTSCDRISVSHLCICKQCLDRGYGSYTARISSLFDAGEGDGKRSRAGGRARMD